MSVFISATRLKKAIDNAGRSRAQRNLLDFLIVKRSLKAKGASSVALTQSEPAFISAVNELASCYAKEAPSPYFNLYSVTDNTHGYRSAKFPSNGTNSTIANTGWRPVIDLTDEKPRKASLKTDYIEPLTRLCLKADKKLSKPSLDDMAVWYHRHEDVSDVLAGKSEPGERIAELRRRFIEASGLTADEVSALFEGAPASEDADAFAEDAAQPLTYLPGISSGLAINPASLVSLCSLDLVTALAAKPFAILTGPSGTGKSRAGLKLAEGLQRLIGEQVKGAIYQLVPVGPDWTSPKRLLGFRTPFGETRKRADGSQTNESYEITETLRLILRACHPSATAVPFFLIFDEMNLSHVERYFATFLSLMEAGNSLEDDDADRLLEPQNLGVISEILQQEDATSPEAEAVKALVESGKSLTLPANVFFIGTVNVDETTYMFSPKVLDRAHVIEIESQRPGIYLRGEGVQEPGGVIETAKAIELLRNGIEDRDGRRYEAANPASLLDRLSDLGVGETDIGIIRDGATQALDGCYRLLAPVGFPFGYRTSKEVFVYLYVWAKGRQLLGQSQAELMEKWPEALDKAIMQKVLPKLHGSKRVLGESLKAVAAFLRGGSAASNPPARYSLGAGSVIEIEAGSALAEAAALPLSATKLEAMHSRLTATGYVSFVS